MLTVNITIEDRLSLYESLFKLPIVFNVNNFLLNNFQKLDKTKYYIFSLNGETAMMVNRANSSVTFFIKIICYKTHKIKKKNEQWQKSKIFLLNKSSYLFKYKIDK